jgi:hypothetical protein
MHPATSGIAGLIGGLLVGIGGMWMLQPGPVDLPSTRRPEHQPVVVERTVPSAPPAARDDSALAACEEKLRVAQQLWDHSASAAAGTPVPFTADVPPAFQPANFAATVERLTEQCPDAEVELVHTDCTEYPCMAWLRTSESSALTSCAAWRETYGDTASSRSGRIPTADGDVRFVAVGPLADDVVVADRENASKRLKARWEAGEATLFDELGGVELTEIEKLERDVAFWRRAAETNEAAGAMLERFEAQLEAARRGE